MAQNIYMRFHARTTANNGNGLFNFIETKFRFNMHTYMPKHNKSKISEKEITSNFVGGDDGAIEENV